MIVVAGGIKGGSGKTTVATNLAIIRSLEGKDVLLIDADDQETATDFTNLRNEIRPEGAGYTQVKLSSGAVRTQTRKLQAKYDDIVIDTGGRDTDSQRAALTVADVLLVPFVPRSFDVWTLDKVAKIVEEIRTVNPSLRACMFLNRADARGADNHETEQALSENIALEFIRTPLGSRKSFANAASEGLSVIEAKPQDEKAVQEIMSLYQVVFNIKKLAIN